ncbi:MAG: hypothetical protein ACE5HX_05910 [bacterium]
MPTPQELIARISRDARLEFFNSRFRHKLERDFLWELLHQAEMQVSIDLKTPEREQNITLSKDARAVLLPNDFLFFSQKPRYKEASDDPLSEGIPITIRDAIELL